MQNGQRAMSGRLEGRDSSLDARLYHDGAVTGLDQLVDEAAGAEERCADAEQARMVRARVAVAMEALTPRERMIVDQRLLPTSGDDGVTLADIGRTLGLSRERVRQLEERVKRKLGKALRDLDAAA